MIEIREVKTKKEFKKFVDLPDKIYKDNKYYCPPLRMDEYNFFDKKKNVSYEDCDIIYLLAYKDGEVAGRITGIIQKLYNAKVNEKRARFSRFECIKDFEVAKALLDAVEKWAKEKGMEIVHGPLGFNDLDREGLLIEGFDQPGTYETQYNLDYYKDFIEQCGYTKEIDWLEHKLYPPKEPDKRVADLAEKIKKRYHLTVVQERNKRKYLKKYQEGVFDVLDNAYGTLYGVVPYTPKVRQSIVDQFKLFINFDYVITIVNEKEEVVAFGFAIPWLADAVRKCNGRLFPFGVFGLLKALKKHTVADFALVAVRQDYQNKGITAIILNFIQETMIRNKLEYVESNINLESNSKILAQWEYFKCVNHKRRRCYIKKI